MRDAPDDRPLRAVWRLLEYLAWRLRCRTAKTAALWTAAVALAALAAVAAVGAAVGLPAPAFLLALGAGAAAVAVAAGLGYRPRPSATYLARLVEQERPELKESLVTLVELAADASSDRSMQTALARRAARILSRDPPHAFLPDVSWRRPGWALAASAVMLGGVLWMAKGTAVAPWLPGAAAGTPADASTPRGQAPSSTATAKVPDTAPARAARDGADGAAGPTRPAPRKRGGEHDAARAGGGGPDVRGAREDVAEGAARDGAGGASQSAEGSGDVAQGGAADVRRGAGAAREDAGGAARGQEARAAREAQWAGGTGTADGDTRPLPRPARTAPLPSRNPSEVAPENVLDAMRHKKPLIEGDARGPDGDEPPRPFLGKMGVSTADDRRYTAAWPAGVPRPRPDASSPVGRARTVTGSANGRVLDATGDAGARPVVVPADAAAGERGALIHAAEVRVSPRLRPAVRSYFERIGRLTAGE